jgi:hypothetical protein
MTETLAKRIVSMVLIVVGIPNDRVTELPRHAGYGKAERAAIDPSVIGFRLPTEAQWDASTCTVAYRIANYPDSTFSYIGFRVSCP